MVGQSRHLEDIEIDMKQMEVMSIIDVVLFCLRMLNKRVRTIQPILDNEFKVNPSFLLYYWWSHQFHICVS